MAKKVIRLTEQELVSVIENSAKKLMKEDMMNASFDYVNDILNSSYVSDCVISFDNSTYGEGELELVGNSGNKYYINVYVNGKYVEGAESNDYDVPDDSPETEEWISDLEVKYMDEESDQMIELGEEVTENEDIKRMLSSHIEFDWSNYDPYEDNF